MIDPQQRLESWATYNEHALLGPGYEQLPDLPPRKDEILSDEELTRASHTAKMFRDTGIDDTALEGYLKVPRLG